ncbi:hypothetical protein RHO15_09635 [Utexia brackfieldae]|uniref:phage head morphogenesis protein n=1 Tax=Utexia brackfieldae TaxID=3074108 RepID=UPI00370D2EE6
MDFLTDNAIFSQSLLERLKAQQKQLSEKLARQIKQSALVALVDFEGIISTKKQLVAVNKAISEALTPLLDETVSNLFDEVVSTGQVFSDIEYKGFKSLLNDRVKAADADRVGSAIANTPLGLSNWNGPLGTFAFIASFKVLTLQKVQNAAIVIYSRGGSFADLGLEIAGLKDSFINNYNAVASTSLQHAYSVAVDDFFMLNSDLIDYEEFSSILDNQTSAVCRSLDGQRFKVGDGPRPPLHPHCRSRRIPILAKKYQDQTGLESPSRHKDPNYYQWLSNQSAKRQDFILGPTRGKLFRDGGIDADRFARLQLNKNFKPLTLEELKKIIPDAFENAGIN